MQHSILLFAETFRSFVRSSLKTILSSSIFKHILIELTQSFFGNFKKIRSMTDKNQLR